MAGNPGPDPPLPAAGRGYPMTVGGKSVTPQFAGLAPGNSLYGGTPGTDQVVFTVPAGLTPSDQPVVVTVGGQSTKSLMLRVQAKVVITDVQSGASYGIGNAAFAATQVKNVEAGSWVSIVGDNLSATNRIWQGSDFPASGTALPTSLDGVSVTINGQDAAVYFISPTQVNVQAPALAGVGTYIVRVKNSYGSAEGVVQAQSYAPAFFPFPQAGTSSGTAPVYATAVHTDRFYVLPAGYYGTAVASRPAKPGDFILLYGTGFGPTIPAVAPGNSFRWIAAHSGPVAIEDSDRRGAGANHFCRVGLRRGVPDQRGGAQRR